MVSIIFPAKNEERVVAELHKRLVRVMGALGRPYEIVAVDDGSTDKTLENLKQLAPIKIIALAKNYGQSIALDAGIQEAKGDIIVITDADLQNDPEDIPRMIRKIGEGYDAVVGWRKSRRDSLGRRILSRAANWLARKVTGLNIHDYACGLKVFRKQFIEGVRLYGEMHVFLAAILNFRGAKVVEVEVKHHERAVGQSKHSFTKAVKNIADLLTVKFLMSTSRPLVIFGGLGVASWLVGIIAALLAIGLKLYHLKNFGQTPLPIISSLFVILGFLLVMMGLLAELILRAYYEGGKINFYTIRDIIEKK